MSVQRQQRWQKLVERITDEYRNLPAAEKEWIAGQLQQIEQLQQQLNQLFEQGNGLSACSECLGGCCAKGHNHMTLANLLSYLQSNELPPQPDFSRTCPFLGESGCLLTIVRRPYNCISFVCDIIENNLTSQQVEGFYRLEQSLRTVYRMFAERYKGGSMTGLLLQSERLGDGPFLQRKNLPQD